MHEFNVVRVCKRDSGHHRMHLCTASIALALAGDEERFTKLRVFVQ